MTRGFVTVATGKEEYYALARNLLRSYRAFTASPMPFAILCEAENEITEEFDDAVVLEPVFHSTVDKLSILTHSPYDEAIFIDADSLAYGDLNRLWDFFEGCDDVTAPGFVRPLAPAGSPDSGVEAPSEGVWYTREDAGRFGSVIDCALQLHGGLYFVRRGAVCQRMASLTRYIREHFTEFHFRVFTGVPVDETIMSLAMAVCRLKPVFWDPAMVDFLLCSTYNDIDILQQKVRYRTPWIRTTVEHACLVHFGHSETRAGLYRTEVYKLCRLLQNPADLGSFSCRTAIRLHSLWYHTAALPHTFRLAARKIRKAIRKAVDRKKR